MGTSNQRARQSGLLIKVSLALTVLLPTLSWADNCKKISANDAGASIGSWSVFLGPLNTYYRCPSTFNPTLAADDLGSGVSSKQLTVVTSANAPAITAQVQAPAVASQTTTGSVTQQQQGQVQQVAQQQAAQPANGPAYAGTKTFSNAGLLGGDEAAQINLNPNGVPQNVDIGTTQAGQPFVSGNINTIVGVKGTDGSTTYYQGPTGDLTSGSENGGLPSSFTPVSASNASPIQLGSNTQATVNQGGGLTISSNNNSNTVNVATNGQITNSSGSLLAQAPSNAPNSNQVANSGNGQGVQSAEDTNSQIDQVKDQTGQTNQNDRDCPLSNKVFDMTCRGTRNLITTSQAVTVGSQIAGSTVMNTMGGMEQQNLMMNGGTQVQAMQSAASLQMKAAIMQTMIGASQLGFGYQEQRDSSKHNTNADQLSSATQRGSYHTQTVVNQTNVLGGTTTMETVQAAAGTHASQALNSAASNLEGSAGVAGGNGVYTEQQRVAQAMVQEAKRRASTGVNEQKNMAQEASQASMMNYMQGAQTTAAGVLAMMSAKQAENIANKLANASPVPLPSGGDGFNPPVANPRMPTVVNNPTTSSSPFPLAQNVTPPGAALGSGIGDLGGNGGAVNAPAPGAFQETPPGMNNAAGGVPDAGMGGGTNTAATPPGASEDPQAKYAANYGGGNGGAVYQGGGMALGNGGGRGGTDNPALSLKDAFAQMLGQNGQDAKNDSGVDIMNYRNLASDSQYSPLGRGENIFQTFHETYQGLQRKGRIGL